MEKLIVEIKLSWWLIYFYLPLLILTAKFCKLFNENIEPDWDKVNNVLKRGISLTSITK